MTKLQSSLDKSWGQRHGTSTRWKAREPVPPMAEHPPPISFASLADCRVRFQEIARFRHCLPECCRRDPYQDERAEH